MLYSLEPFERACRKMSNEVVKCQYKFIKLRECKLNESFEFRYCSIHRLIVFAFQVITYHRIQQCLG